jgi:hypothetical protein
MTWNAPGFPVTHDFIFQEFERRFSLAGEPIAEKSEPVFERDGGFEAQQRFRFGAFSEPT